MSINAHIMPSKLSLTEVDGRATVGLHQHLHVGAVSEQHLCHGQVAVYHGRVQWS